jgi:hypothetical protein
MQDLIEEAKEDLENENFQKLLRKYGKIIAGAVAGILVTTALYVGYDSYKLKKREEFSNLYFKLNEEFMKTKPKEFEDNLEKIIKSSGEGFIDIAKTQLAVARVSKNPEKSLDILLDVTENGATEETKFLAFIKALELSSTEFGKNIAASYDEKIEKTAKNFLKSTSNTQAGAYLFYSIWLQSKNKNYAEFHEKAKKLLAKQKLENKDNNLDAQNKIAIEVLANIVGFKSKK